MLEGEAGTPQAEVPVVAEAPAPAVGGPVEGEVAGQSTATPKFPGWTGQLSKDQLADIQARVAKDPATLEKLPKGLSELYAAYATLNESSQSALKKPAQDAPKEAWDQFYKELGRPESPEGYTLEKPNVPSGMRYNDAAEKWFRERALERGLTQEQAAGFFGDWNKNQQVQYAQIQEAKKAEAKAALDALKAEWKDDFPDKWEGMKQAFLQFAPGGETGSFFKKIQANGLDNDPDFLRMFRNIYEKIGPPKLRVPSGEGGGSDKKGGFQFKVDGIGRKD
jgi:hypothetical protein